MGIKIELTNDEYYLISKLREPELIRLKAITAKYNRKADLYKKDREAYNILSSKGWLDLACEHMKTWRK